MRVFWLLLLVVFLNSCGSTGEQDINANKTVFRYNEAAGISKLDPARTTSFEDIIAIGHVFEGLVALNEEMVVVPSIASDWDISEDGRKYTFYLRNDVYFHDDKCFAASEGRRVVASDFEYSFFRIVDPSEPSPGKYIFDNADKTEESNYIGFKAIDDRTFCIYLKRPQPSFLNMLCLKHCSVVPHEAIDLYGEDFRANPVGTGPFKFAFWNEDVKLVLLKNDEYWDRSENGDSLPYLDAITITFLPDRHQEYMQFKLGKYEMISGLDQSFQETLLTDFGELKESLDSTMTFSKLPWLKTDYLGFLVDTTKKIAKNSPLSNRLVRQAVNCALDRDELVTYMRKNIGKGASRGFLPKGMPGFDQLTVARNEFDPEKSRELLRKAGYAGEPIKLIVANQYKQMCNYIQRKLKEVGLDVQVDAVSKSVHRKDMATFQANFFLKNWTADYPDATNFYQLFYSNNFAPENGPNYTHFNNEKYDECFELLLEETNDSVKWSLCNQLEAILVEDAPIIPLFYDETVRFFSPRVSGIKANSMNQLDLSEVKLHN